MDKAVIEVIKIVSMMGKSCKSSSIEIDCEGLITRDQNIDTHIKFFASNNQRIGNIALNNIRLSILRIFISISGITFPLRDLLNFTDNKNTFPLGFRNGFHNPIVVITNLIAFEFFKKDGIICWKIISHWKEIILNSFFCFSLFFKLFFISF